MKAGLILSILQIAVQGGAVIGYYAPWNKVSVSELNLNGVTHVNYAFGLLIDKENPYKITFGDDKELETLGKLKEKAGANTKVLLSLGGWTAGQKFSAIAKNPEHIEKFVKESIAFLDGSKGFALDGIDLDWEYPVDGGAKCNDYDPNDVEHYLKLLEKLKPAVKAISSEKLITAAVHVRPFKDSKNNNEPKTSVKEFAEYFDFINVMTYDLYGGWSATSGPNAPFRSSKDEFTYENSLKAWINAGFKPNQINAGLGFYGRSITTKKMDKVSLRMENAKTYPQGDSSDIIEEPKICKEDWNGKHSGNFKYNLLRKEIFDNTDSPKKGYKYYWDEETLTPYLYNQNTSHFVSYDNPESLTIKTNYAACEKLMGVMIWDLATDYNNELLTAVVKAQSVDETSCSNFGSSGKYSITYNKSQGDAAPKTEVTKPNPDSSNDKKESVSPQEISGMDQIKDKPQENYNNPTSQSNSGSTEGSSEMQKMPPSSEMQQMPPSSEMSPPATCAPGTANSCQEPNANIQSPNNPPNNSQPPVVIPEANNSQAESNTSCLQNPTGNSPLTGRPCSEELQAYQNSMNLSYN